MNYHGILNILFTKFLFNNFQQYLSRKYSKVKYLVIQKIKHNSLFLLIHNILHVISSTQKTFSFTKNYCRLFYRQKAIIRTYQNKWSSLVTHP